MKSVLLFTLTLIAFWVIAPMQAFACRCSERPDLLSEINSSANIFTGRFISIEPDKPWTEASPHRDPGTIALVIEKVYKGNLKPGQRLNLIRGDGLNCGFEFREGIVGQTWLIFIRELYPRSILDDTSGEWIKTEELTSGVSFCGRSETVGSTRNDLAYLDNIKKLKGKTRLSGFLQYSSDRDRSVEGIEIRITGEDSKFTTRYRKEGFFEIYDLPPGEYIVEIIPPIGWKVGEHWRTRSTRYGSTDGLSKNQRRIPILNGHYDLDLMLIPDTKLSGRVLSPTGTPIPKTQISLFTVGSTNDRRVGGAITDAKGEFTVESVQPGAYHIVVNESGKIDDGQPFGRIYYPGVLEEKGAGVVFVEAGRYLGNRDIQIPQTVPLVEVSGRVVFADGKPVSNVRVEFEPVDAERFRKISARTDDDGRFSFQMPRTATGSVTAENYFWEREYPCPPIAAAREAANSSVLKTNSVPITATDALTYIILRFPFEYCEKKKQ